MDFFKSVFTEEPENSDSDSENVPSPSNSQPQTQSSPGAPDANPNIPSIANAWTFGSGLLKTLASRSESAIQNYRRDLEEFSSGLKVETATIREAASRVVRDLPARLESGAAVAQESLETVGQAIDNIGSTVTEIIVHGKESILADDDDSGSEVSDFNSRYYQSGDINLQNSKPYSRIDAAIRAIQCDAKTYCEEPEESEDYGEWKSGFVFEEKLEEIGDLVEGNIVIAEIYSEIVPSRVDRETFWSRYFYRVYRVKKAEEARTRLVERAISGEEELSWDMDDDDENDNNEANFYLKKEIEESESKVGKLQVESKQHSLESRKDKKVSTFDAKIDKGDDEKGVSEGRFNDAESSGQKLDSKSDDKGSSEGKNGNSDFSVVSSQQPSSHGEEDLGWDEIEDISSGDESKVAARVSPNKADLLKRLSMPDDEEELTWDIEDDDEPLKS